MNNSNTILISRSILVLSQIIQVFVLGYVFYLSMIKQIPQAIIYTFLNIGVLNLIFILAYIISILAVLKNKKFGINIAMIFSAISAISMLFSGLQGLTLYVLLVDILIFVSAIILQKSMKYNQIP